MDILRRVILITATTMLLPGIAYGQSVDEIHDLSPADRKAYMKSMSPDERAAMREKWRNEFDSLTDEQKQAVRAKREAHRDRWKSMSEEERAAKRVKRREHWESMSDEEKQAAREDRRDRKHKRRRHHKGHAGAESGSEPDQQ